MATQAPPKPKATWEEKLAIFANLYGPFTTRWDEFRSFRVVEGFLEIYWPRMESKIPPLVEIDSKPPCACCGSALPMFLRYLTDRNGDKHAVGHECYGRLCELRQVTHLDDNPAPRPLPTLNDQRKLCRQCTHWHDTGPWQGNCNLHPSPKPRWAQSAQPWHDCHDHTPK